MTIIRYVISIRNIWKKDITLNYINILQPVYFIVFLHGNLLQCGNRQTLNKNGDPNYCFDFN